MGPGGENQLNNLEISGSEGGGAEPIKLSGNIRFGGEVVGGGLNQLNFLEISGSHGGRALIEEGH